MDDGRNLSFFVLFERANPKHETAIGTDAVHLEPIPGFFKRNDGREWSERLAMFHTEVKNFLTVRAAGITYDAALPQGSRAKLRPPLKPTNDLSLDQQINGV